MLFGLVTAQATAATTVTVANSQFTPSAVSITVGESVTWEFTEASHNVKGAGWSGNDAFAKGTFSRTFAVPGTFSFVCEAHSAMKGTVTVTAALASAPIPDAAPGPSALAPVGAAVAQDWLFPVAEDLRPPSLKGPLVSLARGATRPRLSVRLGEEALIVVHARRMGAAKPLWSIRRRGTKGLNRFTLGSRGLRPGRYRVDIVAIDAAGNESPVRTATFAVPRS